MSLRRLALLSLLVSAGASAAFAQSEVEPTPRSVALARRYLEDAQGDRILSSEGPAVARYMLAKIPEPAGGAAKADEVRQAMIESANAAVAAKVPAFMEASARIYARIFTDQELADIVAFYDSPSGRAFVAKTADASGPMAELIHSLGAEIQADTLSRFCAREPQSCKSLPPTPAGR
jgi:hypothetical protein